MALAIFTNLILAADTKLPLMMIQASLDPASYQE
jgi:hypothetical protein